MGIAWLPFSIATIMMYGFGQVLAKETRTNVSSANLLLLLSGNIFIMWLAYWAIIKEPGSYGAAAWFGAVAAAALSGMAFVTYYECLKHGKVSVVGTIAGAYAPWTVVLALIFLGESMSVGEGAGVTLVVAAMLIFTYSADSNNGNRKNELIGIAFASASLFFWGTSAALAKGVISEIGDTNFIGVYALVCPTIWVVYWLLTERGKHEMPKSNPWLLEMSMLCLAGGGITMYLAIQNGNVSIVSPVTNLYPIVTIIAAKIRLKEQLSLRQGIALAVLLVSVPLFSL